MLIIKAYVNHKQIDEIWVHNVGYAGGGLYHYTIEKPEGFDNIVIHHRREDGYIPLMKQVLEIINPDE